MSQPERIQQLTVWLRGGRCLRPDELMTRLGVSRATLGRDIVYMRDRLNVPVAWDRERAGWRLSSAAGQTQFELPGLWLSAEEIHALLTMQHLLANLDAGGLMGPHIQPLMKRLGAILGSGAPRQSDIARRIRLTTVGARRIHVAHFQAVGAATLGRRRIEIGYQGRGRNQRSIREVSPQRLVHYRENWYLDAWCHARDALRSFSLDAIDEVRAIDRRAIDLPDDELDAVLGAGYGIFAGHRVRWAMLRFSAHRARWVAAESWHPLQLGRWDSEGRWLLDLPFADPRELVMDILRHVPDVEVLAPEDLEAEVRRRLQAALDRI